MKKGKEKENQKESSKKIPKKQVTTKDVADYISNMNLKIYEGNRV